MYPQVSNKGVNGIAVSSYIWQDVLSYIFAATVAHLALHKYVHIYKLNIIEFNLLYM